ncbi:Stk1 family PASTA domain-containing Ser/Thr kinase [Turicibacter bilis]|uniref:Stk1 family PASTA domain-containing Ser/Thr kinase n=1 Tax=Turicibacter bilis TaxID=2735723 RepID=UPI003F8B7542
MIIGTTINSRYDIKMLIGDGGMANVYLAYDRTLKRHVAIKMLRYELSKDERFIKRFKRESAQVINLDHPNIVHVYTVGDYKQQPFIVMEYVKGKTLKDYLREHGALEPQTVIHIMTQLAEGVLYAHQNNIIHRDLKSQNIMITDDQVVKITDFGIALSSNEADMTQTNTIMGSVHYLAPELARGNLATERSDIYALGIILYELLTGDVPFKGEGAVNIALQHLEAEMPSIKLIKEELPNSLDNIISRCTCKLPSDRYHSVDELLIDLNSALTTERVDEPLLSESIKDEALEKTMVMSDLKKEVSEEMAKKSKKKRKGRKGKKFDFLNSALLVSFTVFLICAITLYYVIIYRPATHKVAEVYVPDVSTMTVTEAEKELKDIGLKYAKVIYIEDENYEDGDVFKTSPAIGTRVKVKSSVTLYVAKTPEKSSSTRQE